MCGLGFLGLIAFGWVVLLLLLVAGMNLWYASVLIRPRLEQRFGPRTRPLAMLAVLLALAAGLAVVLALLFVIMVPSPDTCPVP